LELAETALPGMWTPWAKISCYECHGNKIREHEIPAADYAELLQPRSSEKWEEKTCCDSCGRHVWVDNKIAAEHNLVAKLRSEGIEAEMQRIGGMCSAASCRIPGGYYMLFAEDEAPREFMISPVTEEDWEPIDEPAHYRKSADDVVAFMKEQI
jgi:hypothetical protein